ncbi:MAG: hypothetical protein KatS3mg112_0263 [Thermogutta sp.]|nr:MAG: hypothetical protein KatS3mg112_0263 [Thermogutta sp.]
MLIGVRRPAVASNSEESWNRQARAFQLRVHARRRAHAGREINKRVLRPGNAWYHEKIMGSQFGQPVWQMSVVDLIGPKGHPQKRRTDCEIDCPVIEKFMIDIRTDPRGSIMKKRITRDKQRVIRKILFSLGWQPIGFILLRYGKPIRKNPIDAFLITGFFAGEINSPLRPGG